jgi:hypothetical protein
MQGEARHRQETHGSEGHWAPSRLAGNPPTARLPNLLPERDAAPLIWRRRSSRTAPQSCPIWSPVALRGAEAAKPAVDETSSQLRNSGNSGSMGIVEIVEIVEVVEVVEMVEVPSAKLQLARPRKHQSRELLGAAKRSTEACNSWPCSATTPLKPPGLRWTGENPM